MKEKSVKMVKVQDHNTQWETKAISLPHFQTGDRWDDKKRIAFIQSLLAGIPVPNFYLGENGELLEGQQRTKAISKAIKGELGFSNSQLELLKDCKIRVVTLADYSEKEIVDFYIAINNGGVSHNKMEIAKASLSHDDNAGFEELEAHPLWEKLPVSAERQKVKEVLMQSLLLITSDSGAVEIGGSSQEKLLLNLANDLKSHVSSITRMVQAVDYLDEALKHSQKWLKRGMIPFILKLAVEGLEQGDSPVLFGGFLQQFFGKGITVMTGKKANIPTVSSEYWSMMAKGSGTSKPNSVLMRWEFLSSTYAEKIGEIPEYTEPAYIKEAKEKADKIKQQEKDRQLFQEFKSWKQAQGVEA